MPETSLVVVDPGHFHATLVQQQMYPELSPVVRVYAPLGPDLIDYLSRIARYNRRPQAATDWRLDVHAGPDFLDWIRDQPPDGVAIFSGRNRGNIDRIIAVLETGLHVRTRLSCDGGVAPAGTRRRDQWRGGRGRRRE